MKLSTLPLFAALTECFAWLGQRQEVLAQNIANADTPQYKPRDLAPSRFAAMLAGSGGGVGLAMTLSGHLGGAGYQQGEPFTVVGTHREGGVNTFGNAVVLEEELAQIAKTASDYQLTANIYRKHVDLVKLALGRGSGA